MYVFVGRHGRIMIICNTHGNRIGDISTLSTTFVPLWKLVSMRQNKCYASPIANHDGQVLCAAYVYAPLRGHVVRPIHKM